MAEALGELTRKVFSSPDGKKLLQRWREIYADGPLVASNVYETHVQIGRRDFVLDVIRRANRPVITDPPHTQV